ncbi:Armadillo-like helical-containing protein [Dioscorea alata]|uniref:Armadillo-like helical-containing protein n=1 Tax=Dioscorea alata TaxID=55571 RepID=A0ACB7TX18_DIOAL|nr:Armadillo-like helical-containing protein [Dioscorea alata]
MSAKWRALQHRHRYTYTSIVFPQSFIETLDLICTDELAVSDFSSNLRNLISLTSTYSQISAAKDLAASFARLLAAAAPEPPAAAVRLYLEILFLENSLPLHRTLISSLAKTRKSHPLIQRCFLSLCREHGAVGRSGEKRFLVSRAALSLMGYPKLGVLSDALRDCAELVALDVATGLSSLISDINEGSRPSPAVMEQCQEAMSCLYYLLQRYPSKFMELEEDQSVFQSVVKSILSVLKSSGAFSRDCLVASGVSFCAAVQACMSHEELRGFISRGLFGVCDGDVGNGDLGVKKVMPDGDLYLEIKDLSVLSRLCLLRGILTTVPRTVLNARIVGLNNGSAWTILYDGILPELCKYCEHPIDSHFNFHALTVTQICLQQIKTSILAELADFSGDYDAIPEEMSNRLLRIIWNNLEDPLSQTVKQVHLSLDLLLDVKSSLYSREAPERFKLFLCKIAADLLKLGPHCKGRYIPLASLTKRLGAKSLLELNNKLPFETAYAYVDDDVCCSATSFLKCFLECLRDECWSLDGIENGYESFRGLCLPPILHGLVSGNSKLRTNLNTYALPVVLNVDMDSIFSMLGFISVGPNREENKFDADLNTDQRVSALVSLLKVSRSLALIDGDIDLDRESSLQKDIAHHFAVVCVKAVNVRLPVEWLVLALTHADDSLRIDAAESLFLNPKTASLPSSLELNLMKRAVPLNMRCSSTAFQMKWTSLFRKFFSRVRTALERQVKQGSWQPVESCSGDEDGHADATRCRAESLFHFMKWLSCFLFYSCYPSAPYERKTVAMELILIMMDVWPPNHPSQGNHCLYPYKEEFTSADSTLLLVRSIVDSWDRLRESSFRILLCFPTPLPGISSQDSLIELIRWAKKLVCSPRVRESDAGALTFRLILRKYVMELGWQVGVSDKFCLNAEQKLTNGELKHVGTRAPVVEYISSLIQWLCAVVEEGEQDLSEACRNSSVHGVLLTLRYTFEELDWNSEIVLSSSSEMRCLLEELLELVMRITSLALWVVSADALSIPYDMDDMVEDDGFLSEVPVEMDGPESLPELADVVSKAENAVRPAEQVVMVGCWLAMKEVSLLLGTIIRKIPLPSCSQSDKLNSDFYHSNGDAIHIISSPDAILDLKQLEIMGNHFLQVLLKMKHNGAIDKTRAGFTALCNRLLCSNDSRLCKMTESWMEQLMERTIAKGQTVDDLLRRSAGIPAAFIAFFLSEPEGTPKKLLPWAMGFLINVANASVCPKSEDGKQDGGVLLEDYMPNLDGILSENINKEVDVSCKSSKSRDEGVVPTVHAFNVLRAAFNDTNLATDTSGFCAEALIISIRAFSSPYWEIRNSACLAYTALVRRMIGFLNVQKRESARRALTGLEFFHRYPALHPFLLNELKIATELLGNGYSRHVEFHIAKAIHPSLCPILILLSRLKPSLISSETEDALDPFLLMPYIQRCATQSNLRVRVLASRALTGLVSNEKLPSVFSEIVCCLPYGGNLMNGHETEASHRISFNSIHGVLLQLFSLLEINCENLPDNSKKDQIIGDLIQVLLKCAWIGSIKTCPCPTLNTSFLCVLDKMLGIARLYAGSQHITAIRKLLLELSSEYLSMEISPALAWHDPTKDDLQRQAVSSYFSCRFGGNTEDLEERFNFQRCSQHLTSVSDMLMNEISVSSLQEQVMLCISDAAYEVRIAIMKKLFHLVQCLKPDSANYIYHIWAEKHLQSTVMKRLDVEENPKCLYYCLKIVFSWNILQFENSPTLDCQKTAYDFEYVSCFWNRLVYLNSTVKRMKTREILLCCMGVCVRQFAALLNGVLVSDNSRVVEPANIPVAYKCIEAFVTMVKLHSLPSEPVNMRKAAAESIIASRLLEGAYLVASLVSNNQILDEESHVFDTETVSSPFKVSDLVNLYGCRMLDMWFTCIQLLEDEDVVLRERLAKNVQTCIAKSKGSNGSHCSDSVASQVAKVIESSLEFLSSIFGHWLKYSNFLLMRIFDSAHSVNSRGDLVRQIFDKEIDNHHEEKLLICQICCVQLEKLLNSKSSAEDSNFDMFLQQWRLRLINQLLSFARNYSEAEMTDWIGGIGNHKDTFTSLYANLLGLYVLAKNLSCCRSPEDQYLSKITELKRIIRPYLRNPLIFNLYSLVIKTHENILDDFSASVENFDPYFLLR